MKSVILFAEKLPGEMQKMENAVYSQNYKELQLLAHWLKGAGGTVGYDAFTEPAKELEFLAENGDTNGIEMQLNLLQTMVRTMEVPVATAEANSSKDIP